MSLREKIRNDTVAARLTAKPTRGVLTTLLGEMDTKEKTFNPARALTEDEIVAIVKKFIKNIDDTLVHAERANLDTVEQLRAEKNALETYLPQQLGAEEIEVIIRREVDAGANLKGIMAMLKSNYAGRYDGKLASEIAKRFV